MCKMTEEEKKQIEHEITEIMRYAVGKDYANCILKHEAFMFDVVRDVMECSAWSDKGCYNEDDIRLAIGRVLIDWLGFER